MVIDHICFAMKSLEEGVAYWRTIFGIRAAEKCRRELTARSEVTFLLKVTAWR
jgi:catechol 2,3-dioxygenase-like lactoylglutathione lyase family enzyme